MDDLHQLVGKLKALNVELKKTPNRAEFEASGVSCRSIRMAGGFNKLLDLAGLTSRKFNKTKQPMKILILDIETSPIKVSVWRLGKQVVTLDQLEEDWFVMCWAAKWLGSKRIFFSGQADAPVVSDDKESLTQLRALLMEADIVITQNGKRFDIPKIMARIFWHKLGPVKRFRQWDSLEITRKIFGFTSHKLAYMTETFNETYKKLDHEEFPGKKLWDECLAGNKRAWACMKKYNIHDILALEEFCLQVLPYDNSINWAVYHDGENVCFCGSQEFEQVEGYFHFTNVSKFQLYRCKGCGADYRSAENEISKDDRKGMMRR